MNSKDRKTHCQRPGPDQIRSDPKFRQILELHFGEMLPFVLSNIRRRSIFSLLYAGLNVALLGFILVYLVDGMLAELISWGMLLKQGIAGIFAGSLLIIPVHELLHGLAYKMLGAKKIHFGADPEQMIFYVTADRHPISGREIYFLALLPFLLINLSAILVIILWFPHFTLFVLFLLLSHNIMCIGDFAISNYVFLTHTRVYSFDIVSEKKSFFFQETTNTSD